METTTETHTTPVVFSDADIPLPNNIIHQKCGLIHYLDGSVSYKIPQKSIETFDEERKTKRKENRKLRN